MLFFLGVRSSSFLWNPPKISVLCTQDSSIKWLHLNSFDRQLSPFVMGLSSSSTLGNFSWHDVCEECDITLGSLVAFFRGDLLRLLASTSLHQGSAHFALPIPYLYIYWFLSAFRLLGPSFCWSIFQPSAWNCEWAYPQDLWWDGHSHCYWHWPPSASFPYSWGMGAWVRLVLWAVGVSRVWGASCCLFACVFASMPSMRLLC